MIERLHMIFLAKVYGSPAKRVGLDGEYPERERVLWERRGCRTVGLELNPLYWVYSDVQA